MTLRQAALAGEDVLFTGELQGEDLAQAYASSDIFIFPSGTDTFGIVLLEAMACGLPVAAFPVVGPVDVVEQGRTGCLDWDLCKAVHQALELNPRDCREPCVSPGNGASMSSNRI